MSSPIFLALLTILLWSTSGAFAKSINLPGNAALYTIMVFSALMSFEVLAWYEKKQFVVPNLHELFSKKSAFAALGFGGYWLCLGLSIEGSNNASLPMALQCTWPLFNSLFISLFFLPRTQKLRSKLLSKAVIGMLLGFGGVLILFLGNQSSASYTSLSSVFFALCAGAIFGLYSAYSSTVREEDHLSFLVLSCITGIVVLVPWAVFDYGTIFTLSARHILIAMAYGIIVDSLGTFLWTRINRITMERGEKISSVASLTLALPFLTAFLLYLLYGEEQILQISYVVGLVFLLIGISICNRK